MGARGVRQSRRRRRLRVGQQGGQACRLPLHHPRFGSCTARPRRNRGASRPAGAAAAHLQPRQGQRGRQRTIQLVVRQVQHLKFGQVQTGGQRARERIPRQVAAGGQEGGAAESAREGTSSARSAGATAGAVSVPEGTRQKREETLAGCAGGGTTWRNNLAWYRTMHELPTYRQLGSGPHTDRIAQPAHKPEHSAARLNADAGSRRPAPS